MERLFNALEETINKTAIIDYRKFIKDYKGVSKWFMCSDYCIDDKTKPNDVITFVMFPYIIDFQSWLDFINNLQRTDLKHCNTVAKEFCEFSHSGIVFSFSFIIEKNSIVNKWRDKNTLKSNIDTLIKMINEKWLFEDTDMIDYYNSLIKKLRNLRMEMDRKSFNCKLLSRIMLITFLASYLKYLLYRETNQMEIFAWLSDRGKMLSFNEGIYGVLFEILSYCLCANHLPKFKYEYVQECLPAGSEMFYDEVNRVADFICGGIASYDLVSKTVEKQKHCVLIEDVIADNPNIQIIKLGKDDISRMVHKKINVFC